MLPTKRRALSFLLGLGLLLASGALVYWYAATEVRSQTVSAEVQPPTSASVAPAAHGLSTTLAGFKVLAVFSSENVACMLPGHKRLVLQSTQPDPSTLLATMPHDIRSALQAQGIRDVDNWEISVVGPTATVPEMIENIRNWNAHMATSGCVRTHYIRTPTPACAWASTWMPDIALRALRWICTP